MQVRVDWSTDDPPTPHQRGMSPEDAADDAIAVDALLHWALEACDFFSTTMPCCPGRQSFWIRLDD